MKRLSQACPRVTLEPLWQPVLRAFRFDWRVSGSLSQAPESGRKAVRELYQVQFRSFRASTVVGLIVRRGQLSFSQLRFGSVQLIPNRSEGLHRNQTPQVSRLGAKARDAAVLWGAGGTLEGQSARESVGTARNRWKKWSKFSREISERLSAVFAAF